MPEKDKSKQKGNGNILSTYCVIRIFSLYRSYQRASRHRLRDRHSLVAFVRKLWVVQVTLHVNFYGGCGRLGRGASIFGQNTQLNNEIEIIYLYPRKMIGNSH